MFALAYCWKLCWSPTSRSNHLSWSEKWTANSFIATATAATILLAIATAVSIIAAAATAAATATAAIGNTANYRFLLH